MPTSHADEPSRPATRATSNGAIDDDRRIRARGCARKKSARQVTEECLRRIEADNPRLNAFILVMADEARRQAREADRELAAGHDRGPLHGVPISIKDLLDIRGIADDRGVARARGHVAERDAPTIAHLRQAGAVFVGKTNLHEFAFGTTNEDSAFGPARNPHDPTRSPGGSSGGSAASVAAGMALATIGTDTGGSIRIPAAACGIVGLKPSFGEVSTDGVVPLSRTLDHVGPLAQSVTDACLVYHALLGDAHATPPAPMPVSGLRLAVPRTYFCDLLDDEVRARSRRRSIVCARPARTSTTSRSITRPTSRRSICTSCSATPPRITRRRSTTMPERYTPPVRLRLEMGRYVLAEDYVRALAGREVLRREVDAALARARRARAADAADSGAAHRRERA